MRRKFLIAAAIIVVVIVGAIEATYFLTTPTSPYLAEFRSHPENFLSYTKVIYVLVKGESGRTIANLTYAFQAIRVNYTIRANLICSLKATADVATVSFGTAIVLVITPSTTPPPLPFPVDEVHTLRDGESIDVIPDGFRYNPFGADWRWVQIACIATLNKIKVTFTDGHLFTHDEVIETVNTGGDLFEFLHNNPVETEERVFFDRGLG